MASPAIRFLCFLDLFSWCSGSFRISPARSVRQTFSTGSEGTGTYGILFFICLRPGGRQVRTGRSFDMQEMRTGMIHKNHPSSGFLYSGFSFRFILKTRTRSFSSYFLARKCPEQDKGFPACAPDSLRWFCGSKTKRVVLPNVFQHKGLKVEGSRTTRTGWTLRLPCQAGSQGMKNGHESKRHRPVYCGWLRNPFRTTLQS